MRCFVIVFLCFSLGVFFSCKQKVTEGVNLINPIAFAEKILDKEVQLVDVRTPSEWEEGVIGEPLKINFLDDSFKVEIEKLDKNKPIAIYCKSGGRSAKATSLLSKLGFKEIYELKGGILNWDKK